MTTITEWCYTKLKFWYLHSLIQYSLHSYQISWKSKGVTIFFVDLIWNDQIINCMTTRICTWAVSIPGSLTRYIGVTRPSRIPWRAVRARLIISLILLHHTIDPSHSPPGLWPIYSPDPRPRAPPPHSCGSHPPPHQWSLALHHSTSPGLLVIIILPQTLYTPFTHYAGLVNTPQS